MKKKLWKFTAAKSFRVTVVPFPNPPLRSRAGKCVLTP
jgi:hypothetical protein